MSRTHEMIYEHPSGAQLKLAQIIYSKKNAWKGDTYKWQLSWKAPKGIGWTLMNEWDVRSVNAHSKALKEAMEALDHVNFD